MKLDSLQGLFGVIGAVGVFPGNAISSYKMVNEGCERTYICMYNTLYKLFMVHYYEGVLSEEEPSNRGTLSCKNEKIILQDYALFLLTLNLDTYCIEHLHPDGNELEDVELINAMLAIADIYNVFDYRMLNINMPMIKPYSKIRSIADPYCSEDIRPIDKKTEQGPCDCGDYSGTLDTAKKNKILQDIRSIIDDINPMWQMARAIKINERLNTLPCD